MRELQELLTAEDFAWWVAWYRLEDEEAGAHARLEGLAARAAALLSAGAAPAPAPSRALQELQAREELTRRIVAGRMTADAMKGRVLAWSRRMEGGREEVTRGQAGPPR